MTKQEFIKKMAKNVSNVINIALILIILTTFFTIIQPLKYKASARILIVQEYGNSSDPYAASKSTQYLSDILSEVVYSSSFFNEVMYSGFNIEKAYFSLKEQRRKKEWQKTAQAIAISDTGIIEIDIYHPDKNQAKQIAQAAVYVLKTKHSLYHGGGNKVSIKVIDQPITTTFPVKPNIMVNLILASLFGLAIGAGFIYYYPEEKIKPWEMLKNLFKKPKNGQDNNDMANSIDYIENSDNIDEKDDHWEDEFRQ